VHHPVTTTGERWPISGSLRSYLDVQYELLRTLGAGGMGVVLLARERALERRVAIKVLRPDASTDDESRERFRREARIAARLTHPNIVPLHTFGEVQGELYFVMGYVEGETLAARLEREGRCTPEETQRILSELADALAHAHRAGTVHRDVKPENILLDRESGRALLTDFGIARDLAGVGALTSTGAIVGTPSYMSPEQVAGDATIDGRSDLYALGVVGYRMLSGTLPFSGANAREVMARHISAAVPPLPAQVVEDAPVLAGAVMRALAKAPTDRWTDAGELTQVLRSDDEAHLLPDALVGLDGLVPRSVAIGLATAFALPAMQVLGMIYASLPVALAVGGTIAALSPLAATLGFALVTMKRPEPWRTLLRIGCRPPRWWRAWWPRRFRRPGDVFDRLPPEMRVLRSMDTLVVAMSPLFVLGLIWFVTPAGEAATLQWIATTSSTERILIVSGGLSAFGLGAISTAILLSNRLRRRFHMDLPMLQQAQTLSTVDARWRHPRFAALLGAASPPSRGNPVSTEAVLRELASAGLPLPDGLGETVLAARSARAALDREMQTLREMVGTEELAKLDERLAKSKPGDSPLRAMLTSQRELLLRAERRLGELGALRERLEAQEALLRQQLITLREFANAGSDLGEITGRIRALRADLVRLADGLSGAES
jgi:predicted Ser/Thr protein kinase